MAKLAVIHIIPVTVATFKALAAEVLPGYEVVNFVDDSILPQLRENGGDVSQIEDRIRHYAQYAEQVGANVILSACSSVGEGAAKMRQQVHVPVVRVDDAMAEVAIERGGKIGVAATLATTLRPTVDLLRTKAQEAGKSVAFDPYLIDSAYQKLMAGDKEGHDAALVEALAELAEPQ